MKKPPSSVGHTSGAVFVTLVLLLALPACALARWLYPAIDWPILVGVPALISSFAFFAYRSDKQSAQSGSWRIPEATLHLLALFGGWPGAFLAQQRYRHKTAKASFQLVFWGTVLAYQCVALDSLLDWRFSREVWQALSA